MATHYELLGVPPDAPTSVIRDAYRRAAREHHPDRHGDHTADRMAEVNRAWQVLSDPVRRREYDLSLRQPTSTAAGASAAGQHTSASHIRTVPLEPLEPARFPWKLLGVLFVLGLVFVIVNTATASDPIPPKVDNVLEPGDCVVIESNGDAAERLCDEPHDGVVEVLVPTGDACMATAEPHRDKQGMGTACVRRP